MPKTASRRLVLASGFAALALAATACSSTATTSAGSPGAPAPAPASSSAAPAADATGSAKLVAVDSTTLGTIVTDSAGRTLYRFDNDTNKPSATNCTGACAVKWPPAIAQDKVTLTGVSSSLVGSVTRPDGSKQLTLNGWPLYRFAGDTAAGQVNGQGVGGTWFASTPEGKKAQAGGQNTAQTPAPGQAPSASQSGSGYSYGY
ncbi:hypothetical protein AB0D10_34990 [Kitasatospora sp. NPDC048545]|uniref:hypothetical protein n=1 Tax=Kitasatospora sp. NPDC048545 TaxID=3157208 RepID=UPI00340F78BF